MNEPHAGRYITFEELFGSEPTERELIGMVSGLTTSDMVQTCGKLSALRAYRAAGTLEVDDVIGQMLGGAGEAALLGLRALGRALYFRQRLLATARLGIMVGGEGPPDSFSDHTRLADFARAFLAVADVYEETLEKTQPVEVEEWFASFYLRRVLALHTHVGRTAFPRAYRLFVDLPRRFPDHMLGASFDALMQRDVGLDVDRYLAICLSIHARFINWRSDPEQWLLTSAYWANTTVSAEDAVTVARRWSSTVGDLRDVFKRAFHRGETGLDDIRPLVLSPLIEIEHETFAPVDVELLGEKLVGDGLYWRLVPDPVRPDQEKSDFGASLGHLFEEHCAEVVESAYPRVGATPRRVFREHTYSHGDGPDLVIFDPDCLAMIEAGIDRPNFAATLLRGNLAALDRDIDRLVLPRARQLDRKIRHFRDATLSFTGWDDHRARRIYPVICFVDGFPQGPIIRPRIDRMLQQERLLTVAGVERLAIVSSEELEWLMGLVEDGATLGDLLQAYHSDNLKDFHLHDFLLARHGQPTAPRFLSAEFKAATNVLATELFGGHQPPPEFELAD